MLVLAVVQPRPIIPLLGPSQRAANHEPCAAHGWYQPYYAVKGRDAGSHRRAREAHLVLGLERTQPDEGSQPHRRFVGRGVVRCGAFRVFLLSRVLVSNDRNISSVHLVALCCRSQTVASLLRLVEQHICSSCGTWTRSRCLQLVSDTPARSMTSNSRRMIDSSCLWETTVWCSFGTFTHRNPRLVRGLAPFRLRAQIPKHGALPCRWS